MLKIEHLTKTYKGAVKAADDVSLNIENGDLFGFIGHNGAGKTTTIKCVTGIQDFDEGEIYIDGHSVRKEPMVCKQLTAYIPDNPDLYEHLSGMQYLNFVADIYRVGADRRKKLIDEFSARMEITSRLGDAISSYSHGMKQKLAVVSALIHEPKLLVLDEPFVGLDPKASHTLKMILQEHCQKGNAVFFSTHVLEVVEKLCNKVAIIKNGKIITTGITEEIMGNDSLEHIFLELTDDE